VIAGGLKAWMAGPRKGSRRKLLVAAQRIAVGSEGTGGRRWRLSSAALLCRSNLAHWMQQPRRAAGLRVAL